MPPNTVKVDRGTRWGNPARVGFEARDAAEAVGLFTRMIDLNAGFTTTARNKVYKNTTEDIQRELGGRNLACWCRPGEPCHVDVLLAIANSKIESRVSE
jgi:hypothetical protein